MSLTIYASDKTTLKYTLDAVQASRLHQSLNGECTFDLTMPGRLVQNIAIGDEIRLGDLYFDVVRIGKSGQATGTPFTVSCEHISYELADMEQDAAHFSGDPATVLATILDGTGFSVGTVTVTGDWSITINQATSKRDALQQWAAACGAEISYYQRSINFLTRVGSAVAVILSDKENVHSLSVTLDSRSDTQSYAVQLSRLQHLDLGDAVTITYTTLNLNTTTRVITLDYDPFHPWAISMVTGDYVPNFTNAVTAALEARLKEGAPYFGVTIDKETGLKILRSDGASEAIFNSDRFTMRALIDGTMKDRIYFDPITGDYVFDGRLGADAVFTDSLYAEQGDIAELTVDRLSTSRRIRKYILGDTSDDNYIRIQDNYIRWITGSAELANALLCEDGNPLLTEDGDLILLEEGNGFNVEQATNRYGQGLYWQRQPVGHTADGYPTDADGQQIYTTTDTTNWPVMVYRYLELVKMEEAFAQQGTLYQPQIILGAGDENGNSRGYIYKEQKDLLLRYVSSAGKNVDVKFTDSGFVDALHRRIKSCAIDTANGTVEYTLEGDSSTYELTFSIVGNTVTYTWPDGFECEVTVV